MYIFIFIIMSAPKFQNFEESQRKVILVARALLRQPDILFMDEGAIDIPDLEDTVYLNALFQYLPNTTIIASLDNLSQFRSPCSDMQAARAAALPDSNPALGSGSRGVEQRQLAREAKML